MVDYISIGASVVISLLGSGLLGKFLLQKLKAEQNKEITRLRSDLEKTTRALQAELDRTVLVHRAQFEAEFQSLRRIWSKVVEVRGCMAALRPIFDLVNSEQTQEEADAVFAKRFQNFVRALGEAKDTIFESEPFITEDIYKELHHTFLLAAEAEKISVATTKHLPKGPEWIEQGEKNNANLQTSAARVSALIRARLAALTVVGQQ